MKAEGHQGTTGRIIAGGRGGGAWIVPQNGQTFSTPPLPGPPPPGPRRGGWCLELHCRPPHAATHCCLF